MVNVDDFASRPSRAMRPEDTIATGQHRYRLIPTRSRTPAPCRTGDRASG